MCNTIKSFLFALLLSHLGAHAMESQPDRIELGKRLVEAAEKKDQAAVEKLIKQGADLNQRNVFGWTALMCAASKGHSEIVRMLIDANVNLDQQSIYGKTALVLAARQDQPRICHLIVQARLRTIAQQKERVYTTLNCLKRLPCGQYPNLRNIFIPMLRAMIQEVRQAMLNDINRVENDGIKRELHALCDEQ